MNIYKSMQFINFGARKSIFDGFSLAHSLSYPDLNAVGGAASEKFVAICPVKYASGSMTISIYHINWVHKTLEHFQDIYFPLTNGCATPRLSLSGNILAFAYYRENKVILYEYNNPAGKFEQTVTLENSSDYSFGSDIMLYGNELIVGSMSGNENVMGGVHIYERINASTWNEVFSRYEGARYNYGRKVNMHNGIALCGLDVYGATSDVFQKINGTWTYIETSEFTAGIGGGSGNTLVRPMRSTGVSPITGEKYVILKVQKRSNNSWVDSQEFHLHKSNGYTNGLFPLVRFADDGSMLYTSRGIYAYFKTVNGNLQLVEEATYNELGIHCYGESLLSYFTTPDGSKASIFMGQYNPAMHYVFLK